MWEVEEDPRDLNVAIALETPISPFVRSQSVTKRMAGLRVFVLLALVAIAAGFAPFSGMKASNNRFLTTTSLASGKKNYGPGTKAAKPVAKGFGKPVAAPAAAKETVKTTAFSVVDVLTAPLTQQAPAPPAAVKESPRFLGWTPHHTTIASK